MMDDGVTAGFLVGVRPPVSECGRTALSSGHQAVSARLLVRMAGDARWTACGQRGQSKLQATDADPAF